MARTTVDIARLHLGSVRGGDQAEVDALFERVAVFPLAVSVGVDDQVDGEVGAVEAELRSRPWPLEVDVPTEELVASGPPEEPSRVPIARTR